MQGVAVAGYSQSRCPWDQCALCSSMHPNMYLSSTASRPSRLQSFSPTKGWREVVGGDAQVCRWAKGGGGGVNSGGGMQACRQPNPAPGKARMLRSARRYAHDMRVPENRAVLNAPPPPPKKLRGSGTLGPQQSISRRATVGHWPA